MESDRGQGIHRVSISFGDIFGLSGSLGGLRGGVGPEVALFMTFGGFWEALGAFWVALGGLSGHVEGPLAAWLPTLREHWCPLGDIGGPLGGIGGPNLKFDRCLVTF